MRKDNDEFILDVLRLRRNHTPSYVARKLNITKEHIQGICDEILRADLMVSTRKNVEKIADIALHYPKV